MKNLVIIILLLIILMNAREKTYTFATDTYTIQQGETLWSIAKQYKPADMDIREYIDLLERTNGITANVQVNQEITILLEVKER